MESVELPSLPEDIDLQTICVGVLNAQRSASTWVKARPFILIFLVILLCELVRFCWHHIRLVALNFRRNTPPSVGYSVSQTFDDHAAFVERVFCDHPDVKYCIEGLFLHRKRLQDITRDMLEDALLAYLAVEVRRWYPKKHRLAANKMIERIENTLGCEFRGTDKTRLPLRGGASIAAPIPYDAAPDAFRKPFMCIGEQRLCVYFKPLPVQCAIWSAKALKLFFLWHWGFQWRDLGPVRVWVKPVKGKDMNAAPPLLFCPGLFLGSTAYLYWIFVGLLPLARDRPLFLLEMPHLSTSIDPRRIAYALQNSWPSTDEISDCIANFLHEWPGPCDIVGNSFGTAIMTIMRREHRHLFRKFIYIDPICFVPCYPAAVLQLSSPDLDSHWALLRAALQQGGGRLKLKWLLKFLVIRPAVFGDLEVQYVAKRGLYFHELLEHGVLGQESLVVIGKQDELLNDPTSLGNWARQQWPESNVQFLDATHGAMMGHPQTYARLLWEHLKDHSG